MNKIGKLICNVNHEKDYAVHIENLQQATNNGLKLAKVTKFKQQKRVKSLTENEWKNRNIKLVTNDMKIKNLAPEPSYKSIKYKK